jgi:hypothetical protein
MMHTAPDPLYGIWGSSESDVFVVGEGGTILHYNGSDWSHMDSGVTETLYRVWGSSGTDVYVVGESGTILRYDGSWSDMASDTAQTLSGVWGSSVNNVFAVGEEGTILHYVPDTATTTTSTSGPGDCIGEEIYGNYSEEAELLRYLRDEILIRTLEGQELIRLYYEWSPVIVYTVKGDEELKEELKEIMDGILPLIREALE